MPCIRPCFLCLCSVLHSFPLFSPPDFSPQLQSLIFVCGEICSYVISLLGFTYSCAAEILCLLSNIDDDFLGRVDLFYQLSCFPIYSRWSSGFAVFFLFFYFLLFAFFWQFRFSLVLFSLFVLLFSWFSCAQLCSAVFNYYPRSLIPSLHER